MDNLDSAKEILKAIEMPERQQNDISAYTLLALANITFMDTITYILVIASIKTAKSKLNK